MPAMAVHTIEVPEDHEAVLQLCNPSLDVAVESLVLKFSPLTVTSPPTLAAAFSVQEKLVAGAECKADWAMMDEATIFEKVVETIVRERQRCGANSTTNRHHKRVRHAARAEHARR